MLHLAAGVKVPTVTQRSATNCLLLLLFHVKFVAAKNVSNTPGLNTAAQEVVTIAAVPTYVTGIIR